MVRKTSDIALLLGSRGRSRSRSGFGYIVRSLLDAALGRSGSGRSGSRHGRRDTRDRVQTVSVWMFAGGVLLAFAGGYALGGRFGGAAGEAGLRADGSTAEIGTRAGFVGELDTTPLTREAYAVAVYQGVDPAEGKRAAFALARYLHERELLRALPFEYRGGTAPVWVVNVYFDGEAEAKATRDRLRALPADVPDAFFQNLRADFGENWPPTMTLP